MLMFQNGLLATFIPEILMVLGFVLCILTAGFQSHNSTVEHTQLVAQISNYEPQQVSSYQLTYRDFQVTAEVVDEISPTQPHIIVEDNNIAYESPFSTSDGLTFVDFSRPPPTILS
ncbi:MAG: hypothetical protein PHT07_11310 [Paludibacter sp.]|nr:hypothetical protein [Paludibacter sp.]